MMQIKTQHTRIAKTKRNGQTERWDRWGATDSEILCWKSKLPYQFWKTLWQICMVSTLLSQRSVHVGTKRHAKECSQQSYSQ